LARSARFRASGPLLLPLLLVVILVAGVERALAGGTGIAEIPLECRLGAGPWQQCRMRVEEMGAHWFLLVGDRRIEFRHDGSGTVTMGEGGQSRPVTSRWLEDRSLCWDGTCARGEIPLD
jgi:hypothetical protein